MMNFEENIKSAITYCNHALIMVDISFDEMEQIKSAKLHLNKILEWRKVRKNET